MKTSRGRSTVIERNQISPQRGGPEAGPGEDKISHPSPPHRVASRQVVPPVPHQATPWPDLRLNDGSLLPSIAYGRNYWVDQDTIAADIGKAIDVGFKHLDTAQGYYDEDKFAQAMKESGLARDDFYITTKWSRADTRIKESCENSLRLLGVKQVDMYLIHSVDLCRGDIVGKWKDMELVHKLGYAKSIGVSNYDVHDLKTLVASCTVLPAVNQIQFDPHSYAEMTSLIDYCAEHGILIQAYTALRPLRSDPDGPIARVLTKIADRKGVEPEQILLAWNKAKGSVAIWSWDWDRALKKSPITFFLSSSHVALLHRVSSGVTSPFPVSSVPVVTSSSKKARMEGYMAAGEIELDSADLQAIDEAGRKTALWKAARRKAISAVKWSVLLGAVGLASYACLRLA